MTAYRLRRRLRRYLGRSDSRNIVIAVVVALAAAGAVNGQHHATSTGGHAAAAAPGQPTATDAIKVTSTAAAKAISFARSKIGDPYLWGGRGLDATAFDCSGLVMTAYQYAGVSIAATSESEWTSEQQVPASEVQAGDLVFFAGSDGSPTSPGHVGIVVDPATDTMIDAYGVMPDPSQDIEEETYGQPSSRDGLTDPIGFTRP